MEVLKRIQGLKATGLETFVDVLGLRLGDEWNEGIFRAIDRSDLFVLMWSSAARKSRWVRKEARRALELSRQRRSPDSRPIPTEGPPIAPVPFGLRAIHFNDKMLHMIRAAEIDAEKRRQAQARPGPTG